MTKKKHKRMQYDHATQQLTYLLKNESNQLNEQLLIASEKGQQRAAFLLLHQGIDKDRCRGFLGYSPMHYAAARGHINVLQLLLDFGWHVDVRNDAFETPLHLACFNGHVYVAEFLLDRHANINARTSSQETPLFYASRKGQYRTVRLLIRRECDLEAKNCYHDIAEEEARDAKTQAEFVAGNEDLQRVNNTAGRQQRGEMLLSQTLREQILSFLELKSLGYASQVSYRWHRAADNSSLWKKLGVSRWSLLLNATIGIGAVPQMTMRHTVTNNLLRLKLSSNASERPTRYDKAIDGRPIPLSAKEKERPRYLIVPRPRTANSSVEFS